MNCYEAEGKFNEAITANRLTQAPWADKKTLDELTGAFRFSDAVLRHLVIKMDAAVTEPSPMLRGDDAERNERFADDGDDEGPGMQSDR